ncbi:hypothetical protein QTP86_032737 [Hemibagrus guttatus]|nr:hypothetical protein QTP86_032737 [Hemibagrus guttatus]
MLSPLRFTLLSHDCAPSYSTNHIVKFADDTTVVDLITNNNEANYRSEGCKISEDLSWMMNTTSLAKKAQSRLYFLRKLRKARVPPPIMCSFYRGTIESILTSCITVWYGGCTASCRKTLQRIVNAASKIIGVSLPSLVDIFHTRLTSRAIGIAADGSHPSNLHFSLLTSGRRYQSLQAHSTRVSKGFIHQAVRMLNSIISPTYS